MSIDAKAYWTFQYRDSSLIFATKVPDFLEIPLYKGLWFLDNILFRKVFRKVERFTVEKNWLTINQEKVTGSLFLPEEILQHRKYETFRFTNIDYTNMYVYLSLCLGRRRK